MDQQQKDSSRTTVRVPVLTVEDFNDIKIRSIQSSIAGAGAGEFHVYADRTRTERERVQRMEDEAKHRQKEEEYEKR